MSRKGHLTQREYQERRVGKVPQVKPQMRPLMPVNLRGTSAAEAIVCGDVDDTMSPVLVEAEGLVYGIRKGQQRWVVGSHVAAAVKVGGFKVLDVAEPEPEDRPTNLPDGVPGYAPELPGRIDQWPVAFTVCVNCNDRPAAPGEAWCDICLIETTDETPLERALRQARS